MERSAEVAARPFTFPRSSAKTSVQALLTCLIHHTLRLPRVKARSLMMLLTCRLRTPLQIAYIKHHSADGSLQDREYDAWVERVAEDGLSRSVRDSVITSMQHSRPTSYADNDAKIAERALQLLEENLQQSQ